MSTAPYPIFEGFSLQDSNYISSTITYRNIPSRSLSSEKIARKPGVKLLSTDFGSKDVSISGYILGSSASDLQTKIDSFHSNVTRKNAGTLYVDTDRYGTATVKSVAIGDPHYAQDMVPVDIEFLMADPFFRSSQQSVTIAIAAGTATSSETITISGSVFAEPSIIYRAPAGAGQTTTSGVKIEYQGTGETVTWSGTGATTTLAYGSSVTFDYAVHTILEDTTEVDLEGYFSRWEPGVQNFIVTFSGTAAGGQLEFNYDPRYL